MVTLLSAICWKSGDVERISARWRDESVPGLPLEFDALHDADGRPLTNHDMFQAPRLTADQLADIVTYVHPAFDLAERMRDDERYDRAVRAAQFVADGKVLLHGPNDMGVIGTVKSADYHSITPASCTCRDFEYRGGWCKHRLAVRMAQALNQPLAEIPHNSIAAIKYRKEMAALERERKVEQAHFERRREWQRYFQTGQSARRYARAAVYHGAGTIRADIAEQTGAWLRPEVKSD